ncbi:MAG TPA: segregation/condensation protein A [Thermoflexales bacterium]|nr:segregation/condensation protein A [Thermoflexales bacterium]HQW33992.1 segregation/condensation protein A [Thermoflexales bacterium]HQZ23540.1 segregation/condensation protein A [Thermoflexales bacterium]HRA01193.1 segregation/condensation protein A [Thermoflexales bacterium]
MMDAQMIETPAPVAAPVGAPGGDSFHLHLPNYEGPMDALLHMVEDRQLEITKVSLAAVADQFIAYMVNLQNRDPREIAGFVSIAARLILIKSRALLPQVAPVVAEEEEETDDLVAQLRAYQLYKRAAQILKQREIENTRSYVIEPPPIPRPTSKALPLDNVTLDMLTKAMQKVVDRWLPLPPVENVMSRLPFTVNDCMERIRTGIKVTHRVSFMDVLEGVNLRVEIIITLLALLELMKRYEVKAFQGTAFGEIFIEPLSEEEKPVME